MDSQQRGSVRVEPGSKRIRAYLQGQLVVDTLRPLLVWEFPYYPTYYVPVEDVRAELIPTGEVQHSPSRGDGLTHDVTISDATAKGAALTFPDSPIEELRTAVRLDFAAMDEWFEEDEPIYVHPRDPYTRVDILASTRRVVVEVDGQVVADSSQPRILFETGLPPRYYIPLTDVRMDLLRPSATQTQCPYKGTATYWSLVVDGAVHEDVVWIYRSPIPESQKIAGLACLYNEKVDISLDGVRQERPHTHFS
ncbi:MAG TPA: DUF427 domain-containing protein [Acidimicrobiales bacterium]|jgi:uncharacterized protein (DUF427 family)|nr:DUF427 domain-containing protein [Acidimicrobiales bacterium]